MKTLLLASAALCAGIILLGCNHIGGGSASVTGNPTTGDITGTVEIVFKDAAGNVIKRSYPRTHPAVQHLLANP